MNAGSRLSSTSVNEDFNNLEARESGNCDKDGSSHSPCVRSPVDNGNCCTDCRPPDCERINFFPELKDRYYVNS